MQKGRPTAGESTGAPPPAEGKPQRDSKLQQMREAETGHRDMGQSRDQREKKMETDM